MRLEVMQLLQFIAAALAATVPVGSALVPRQGTATIFASAAEAAASLPPPAKSEEEAASLPSPGEPADIFALAAKDVLAARAAAASVVAPPPQEAHPTLARLRPGPHSAAAWRSEPQAPTLEAHVAVRRKQRAAARGGVAEAPKVPAPHEVRHRPPSPQAEPTGLSLSRQQLRVLPRRTLLDHPREDRRVTRKEAGSRQMDPVGFATAQHTNLVASVKDGPKANHTTTASPYRANMEDIIGHTNQDRMDKLMGDLLKKEHYNKFNRPVPECSTIDCSHRIGVQIGLKFEKLVSIDEKRSTMQMLLTMSLCWADHRLAYNASTELGEMFPWDTEQDSIPVDADLLWTPDVQLANSAKPMKDIFKPRAMIYDESKWRKDGYNVRLRKPILATVECALNLRDFPFDTQHCQLIFRGWSANIKWIALRPLKEKHDIDKDGEDHYLTVENEMSAINDEFNVTNLMVETSSWNSLALGDGSESFPQVAYVVELKRHAHYYVFTVILPLLLLVVLSVGTFYIEPEKGERVGFSVTLVLTIMAVAFFSAERLPSSGGGDTWLERFQAVCYIVALCPIVITFLLEVCGREVLQAKKYRGETHWIADAVDRCLRVPFVLCVCMLVGCVAYKIYWWGKLGEAEPSVLMLLVFMFSVLALLFIAAALDIAWSIARFLNPQWYKKLPAGVLRSAYTVERTLDTSDQA